MRRARGDRWQETDRDTSHRSPRPGPRSSSSSGMKDPLTGSLERPGEGSSPERILAVATLAILPALFVALFWIGQSAFFLLFAGILFAAILDAATRALAGHTPLPRMAALGVVIGAIILALAAVAWFGGSALAGQAGELLDALEEQAGRIGDALAEIRPPAEGEDQPDTLPGVLGELGGMLGGGGGGMTVTFAQGVFGAFANAFVIFFIGVFLALDPDLYKRGLVRLFPVPHRAGVDGALHAAGETLRDWLVGQLLSMSLVTALTLGGLLLVGYPLAVPLAILAGLLTFVPNLGPLLTYIPIVLAGLSGGLTTVAMGVAVYAVAQTIESYVFTPVIQKRMVSLPPALILFAQVLGGILFGLWGIALATPLAAVLRLWLERYYVRAELEDDAPEA